MTKMLITKKYIILNYFIINSIIYQITANTKSFNELDDDIVPDEFFNENSYKNGADLMIVKTKPKEILSKTTDIIDTTTKQDSTETTDNPYTTDDSSTPTSTDKPVEESVVTNYTLCEEMQYEDIKEEISSYENKLGVKSTLTSMNTSPDTNFTVGDVVIKSSNESSLVVAWEPKEGYEVQWYIIEWYNAKENKLVAACRTDNETFNYTITHLFACTTYEVRVFPATNTTRGHHKLVIDSTALIVDKDSLKLTSGPDWIKVSWALPNNDCISKNNLTYCNFNGCQTVQTTTTAYNVTNAIPCTNYNFTLTIIRKNGEFGNAYVNGSTEFMKPGAPSSVSTETGKDSLTVMWTAPVGATCVFEYRILIYRQTSPKDFLIQNTTETSITFFGLKTCSTYEVTIIPVDKNGNNNEPAKITSNRTLAPVPDSPYFKLAIPTNRSINITWKLPLNEFNNCEDIQITTECVSTKTLGHGYSGLNANSSTIIFNEITTITVESLSPYTEYNCYSIASNSQGNSSQSQPIPVQTLEDAPSSPKLSCHNFTDNQFVLSWEQPEYLPGHIKMFEVNLTWYYKFHIPVWCGNITHFRKNITGISGDSSSLVYNYASPYSVYEANIRAKTEAGWGNYSDNKVIFETAPGASGPVSDLTFNLSMNSFDPNILDAYLIWGLPCYINGPEIELFNITGVGQRKNFENHYINETFSTPCFNDTCRKKLSLKDEYSYLFNVSGKVKDYKELGEIVEIQGSFPAGIPPLPPDNYTNQITIDPFKARRTTSTATILLPLFPNTNGDIKCYAIIVAKAGYNNESFSRINTDPETYLDNTASWFESKQKDFTIPYQAIKFCANTHISYVVDYGRLKALKFVIGDDMETCEELSMKKYERSYCNGPLNPDEWYDVRMRAFTTGGYRDSKIFVVKTNAEIQVSTVIGSILGVLSLGILITMMLLIRKCSLQIVLRRFLHSDMPGSPVPTPFNRRKFIAHCQQLADNPGKLSNEFQLLQTLSVDLQMPANTACLQANRKKNRYTDVLPYDFSRVKLNIIDNDPNTDYINASFIKGFSGMEEYIACQGPKEETTYDFWRMIDQYDVKIIVMLTQLVEKNKEKCHQYFPTIRETFTYENFSIRCSSELDYRTFTQRTLILQKNDEKRNIIHLHFKDWPDHDVPEDYDPMINFCQTVRRNAAINRGLIVIHCSAGIGRTGTLIAIDILLQHIKENRKLDVFGTVYRLRHHRINMVQRETQYAYIYNCIRQVLKNPYFSKSYKPPSVDPITDNNFNNKKNDNSMTNLVSSLETQ
ncbi:receptor-type tyrosine-protein phosphatase F isoform X3 [Chelonus insularis]|uniref:receptor-type tyrosine-protein phosphatase F isoform X3 n=1 Tax=Chelonus insularis TaxID=460826 RepID=UPI00158EB365|nr:receptor-type tyrosine-protein phosphatase F isoform X3 [Chelonus insularis]XP_034948425.1 receptor-type tyrosine-protein phosphatase F isoform X3 [Chelonus insularis]